MQLDWDEDDLQVLRELVSEKRRSRRRSAGPRMEYSYGELATSEPEVYVARVLEDGVSAREDTTLGSGACEIYRINNDDILQSPFIKRDRVLNLTTVAFAENDYVVINREKYGRWLIQSSAAKVELPFPVKITDVVTLDNGCLAYTFKEQNYTEGCDGFEDKEGGRTGEGGAGAKVTQTQAGTVAVAEIQTVVISGPPEMEGTYTTSITGAVDIPFDADAAEVQGYVDTELGAGVVTVSAGLTFTWDAPGVQSLITVDTTNLLPKWKEPLFAFNNKEVEVPCYQIAWKGFWAEDTYLNHEATGNGVDQFDTWRVGTNYTSGSLIIIYDGVSSTTPIAPDATTAEVKATLEADFAPTTFDVNVGPGTPGTIDNPWVINVTSDFDEHAFELDVSDLRGGKNNYRFLPGGGGGESILPDCLLDLSDPTTIPGYVAGDLQFLVRGPGFGTCYQWVTGVVCPDEPPP